MKPRGPRPAGFALGDTTGLARSGNGWLFAEKLYAREHLASARLPRTRTDEALYLLSAHARLPLESDARGAGAKLSAPSAGESNRCCSDA
jgi:hypothetical protein